MIYNINMDSQTLHNKNNTANNQQLQTPHTNQFNTNLSNSRINSNPSSNSANPLPKNQQQATSNDDQSIRNLSFKQREDLIKAIYQEVLGKNPTYAEIDKFAYKDITPNQIRLSLLKSPEHAEIINKAAQHAQDQETINTLKSELKQVVYIVKSLQERVQIKAAILKEKQLELKQLRQFIKKLSDNYPEGPSAFFCTIYKTEYNTQIINSDNNGKLGN